VVIFKQELIIGLMLLLMATAAPAKTEAATSGGWEKTFGGSGEDVGTFVQVTNDGGYIVTGSTTSHISNIAYSWLIKSSRIGEVLLIKTDANGSMEWERTFGGLGKDIGFSVQETNDGGYIIVGATRPHMIGDYDIWLIKTDSEGSLEWDNAFGGPANDWGASVQETKDGGYVITGGTESYGAGIDNSFLVKSARTVNLWLIKTDSKGDPVWDRTFGGSGFDEGAAALETIDGNYIVSGYTTSYGAGGNDIWLIKTDSQGIELWDKTFGGSGEDVGFSVQETSDEGYIITGGTDSYGAGNKDVWLIKTDSNGTKEWDKTFGKSGFDEGTAVQETKDGGYIITGYTTHHEEGIGHSWLINTAEISYVWLIKTNMSGDMEWNKTFGGPSNDWGTSVQETNDGSYIITGGTESYDGGSKEVLLIKVEDVP